MNESLLLRDLALLVPAAAALGVLGRRAGVPGLVAYVVAGLLLGPVSGVVQVDEGVELLAEAGIALLLFLVGLELSLERIRDVGGVAFRAGAIQVGATGAAAAALAWVLGFRGAEALLLGAMLAFSSTVVAVKLLEEKGELAEPHGRLTLGILLVQDLAVVMVLTLLSGAGGEGGAAAAGGAGLLGGLARAAAGMAVLVAVAAAGARWVLPGLWAWGAGSRETLFVWSLAWCFAFIEAAHLLGLSVEMGAFLAGVSLAQLPYNHEMHRRVQPLATFFLALFFVSLGAGMDLGPALERPGTVLALAAFALLLKPALVAWILARAGVGERTSARTGLHLGQVSEFSLILAALAAGAGLASPSTLSVVAAATLVTVALSSLLIVRDRSMTAALERAGALRWLRAPPDPVRAPETALEGHVVVVGMNALGRRLVRALDRRGTRVVGVDTDPAKLRDLPGEAVLGSADHPDVLEEAGARRARLVVSALHIEDANRLLAWRCRELGVPAAVHAFQPVSAEELEELDVAHLMISRDEGTRRFAEALGRAGVVRR